MNDCQFAFWAFFLVMFFGPPPTSTGVVKELLNNCSIDEFQCTDGACVSVDHVCDGRRHCADGSDETTCHSNIPSGDLVLHRIRRQATKCRKNQWKCRDGTCISFDGKCDGVTDCPDKSDETHALCRKIYCQSNWFRCTYGACVDGTAPCNGVNECADGSDELLPRCRNETDEVRGQFKCLDGTAISAANHCDGVADCPDGSDETVRACAANPCQSYLFQCAYGACVDSGADCNGKIECADGSDESDELCNRISPGVTTTPKPIQSGNCVLPPYPPHGSYIVGGAPNASPGQSFYTVQMNVTCNPGYGVVGDTSLYCIDGSWSQSFPECVRFCRLKKHPSVEYRCLISSNSAEGSRDCNDQEPSGTVVRPECKAPNYYYSGVLNFMRCIEGSWDYVAICTPGLIKNGTNITILVKDIIEVYVHDFNYSVPLFNEGTLSSISRSNPSRSETWGQRDPIRSVTPLFPVNAVTPVRENVIDYDIDEGDWRIGKPVNVNINNSTVVVNSDRVVFLD